MLIQFVIFLFSLSVSIPLYILQEALEQRVWRVAWLVGAVAVAIWTEEHPSQSSQANTSAILNHANRSSIIPRQCSDIYPDESDNNIPPPLSDPLVANHRVHFPLQCYLNTSSIRTLLSIESRYSAPGNRPRPTSKSTLTCSGIRGGGSTERAGGEGAG